MLEFILKKMRMLGPMGKFKKLPNQDFFVNDTFINNTFEPLLNYSPVAQPMIFLYFRILFDNNNDLI